MSDEERAMQVIRDGTPLMVMQNTSVIGMIDEDDDGNEVCLLVIAFHNDGMGGLNFAIDPDTAQRVGESLIEGAEKARLEQAKLDAARSTKN